MATARFDATRTFRMGFLGLVIGGFMTSHWLTGFGSLGRDFRGVAGRFDQVVVF